MSQCALTVKICQAALTRTPIIAHQLAMARKRQLVRSAQGIATAAGQDGLRNLKYAFVKVSILNLMCRIVVNCANACEGSPE